MALLLAGLIGGTALLIGRLVGEGVGEWLLRRLARIRCVLGDHEHHLAAQGGRIVNRCRREGCGWQRDQEAPR